MQSTRASERWGPKLREMIPSFGSRLSEDARLCEVYGSRPPKAKASTERERERDTHRPRFRDSDCQLYRIIGFEMGSSRSYAKHATAATALSK